MSVAAPTLPPSLSILKLVTDSWKAGVVSAFAELGIADVLQDRALTPRELAVRLNLDYEATERFCRAAAAVALVEAHDDDRLTVTPLGEALSTSSANSMRNFARWSGSIADRTAWCYLPAAIRSGRSPFAAVHGVDVWEFFRSNPETAQVFEAAMTEASRQVIRPVVDAFDFARFACVVDVGGGRGALLTAVLVDNPQLEGVLFDQADVVDAAQAIFTTAGVADRCRVESGSFFESVPAGADLYLLSNVLHDWDDPSTTTVLRVISQAMAPGATVAIVEAVSGVDARFNETIGVMDMDMLLLCDGKQRTVEQFTVLMDRVGIEFVGVHRAGLQSVVEGRKK